MANKLLIIEDDADLGSQLRHHYQSKGWETHLAHDINQARYLLLDDELNPHVIIADLGLPDGNILDHLEDIHEETEHSEWIFVIDESTPTQYERLDELAYDVLTNPLDLPRVDIILKRALRASLTTRRLDKYSKSDSERYQLDAFIGNSDSVKTLKDMLKRLMDVPISSMIVMGETGTGKGLTARIIHNTGLRKSGPLIELNCAALPKDLMESELFGHESGAFTGAKGRHRGLIEQADGGTLFLDEIGDLDIELQAKLLKAIEDKSIRRLGSEREIAVDVQIIAATGVDLELAVKEQRFRDDLYHRLSVFCITLPPLRERKNDLVELVPKVIAEYNSKSNRRVEIVPDPVWDKLLAYNWPGNIRELRNVIERCVLLSTGDTLPAKWLQLDDAIGDTKNPVTALTSNKTTPEKAKTLKNITSENTKIETKSNKLSETNADHNELRIPLDGSMSLEEMDSFIIQTALEMNNFNITETARVLGTTRETLRYRVQKYALRTSA